MSSPYYITTPIYYPNSEPHIGSVYTTLCCDVLARFMRLDGHEVKFLTGTDEHGQKIEQTAVKIGKSPQEFVDEVSQSFRNVLKVYNLSVDDFIRTTEPRHKRGVQHFWELLEKKGYIYLGSYAGWYAVRDEAFYTESDLVDGRAPTGAPVEWVEEPSYFFKLSAFQEKLLEHYATHTDFIAPLSRRNEVLSFVKGGLKDLSVSRTSFKWGIPVPGNESHVIYVWLDALMNYLTALGYPDMDKQDYKTFWPADVHMVGKDILRFHAVYWPAFLMAADLPLPKKIFAHGWWTNKGEKISKSLGNVIDPYAIAHKYGVDQVRYFLIREVPFGNDGDFSEEGLISRANSQLSNELGNLVQRTLSMVWKNCAEKIPPLSIPFEEADDALMKKAYSLIEEIRVLLQRDQALSKYVDLVWQLVGDANRYVDTQAPWALRKNNPPRMEVVLYTLCEVIRTLGILLQPLIPASAGKILDQLGVPDHARTFKHLEAVHSLKSGSPIQEPQGIFPRLVDGGNPETC